MAYTAEVAPAPVQPAADTFLNSILSLESVPSYINDKAAAKPVIHAAAAAPAPALPDAALNPASAPALTTSPVDTISSAAAPVPAPAQLVAGVLP